MTTLRGMFTEALNGMGEAWTDVIGREITIESNKEVNYYPFREKQRPPGTRISDVPEEEQLDLEFDDGYGCSVPILATLWTAKNIYFNYEYDGADFIITKPRNPPDYHGETLKIELLRQWRDYHWQEAFAAEGPLTSQRHRSMAEAYHQAQLLMRGAVEFDTVPEPPTKYRGLKYGEWPE